VRLYLDEMISPGVAGVLRDRGHDVVAAAECGALGASDAGQLARAIHERRALVTYDIADFVILARAAATAGRDHWGLLLINHRHLPPSDLGGLIGALAFLLEQRPDPDGLKNQVVFLRHAAR
jgi:predicted nuclease of predicted toxin-antitoxin system